MARSIWNGTITFGLSTVPIKVHSAIEDKGIHFHQVHAKDGARIKQKRICSKDGKEVPYKQVAKGYEVRSGEYVMLSQDEIDAAAGEQSHLIELEEFVSAAEIDPVYYDRPYFLGPGKDGEDAYRLLHEALLRASRVGVGRWVFHNREYLVAIRPLDAVLSLHTLRFADELVEPDALDLPQRSRAPNKREIEMARKLVDSLHDRFRAESFAESYRQRVLDLIQTKARGEEPDLLDAVDSTQRLDLAAALEASISASGSRGSGRKGARPGSQNSRSARQRSSSRRRKSKAKG